jgi:hypothetical protein
MRGLPWSETDCPGRPDPRDLLVCSCHLTRHAAHQQGDVFFQLRVVEETLELVEDLLQVLQALRLLHQEDAADHVLDRPQLLDRVMAGIEHHVLEIRPGQPGERLDELRQRQRRRPGPLSIIQHDCTVK